MIGREIEKTIIIDNIAENFLYTNPNNGLEIVSWYDDLDDKELDKYIPFLKEIVNRRIPDVREVIKDFRDDFESFIQSS